MKAFTYQRVSSLAEAAREIQKPNSQFIAGGTNLLDLMKLQVETPQHLVDVNQLELNDISEEGNGGLKIGALVSNTRLAADSRIRRDYPVLSRALLAGASGQLRNKATTAGNLLQRTRCPYFYDTAQPCNKRLPGSGCSAQKGYSRQLAVVGGSDHCIATHPSDMAVAMRVLDAVAETMNDKGQVRRIPIADFHRLPEDRPEIDTSLSKGELITSVILPPPIGGRHFYHKVRDRASYAFALVSAAVVIDENGQGRIALGGVAPKPWRREEAERKWAEGPQAVIDALFEKAQPTEQNQFKIELAKRTFDSVLAKVDEESKHEI